MLLVQQHITKYNQTIARMGMLGVSGSVGMEVPEWRMSYGEAKARRGAVGAVIASSAMAFEGLWSPYCSDGAFSSCFLKCRQMKSGWE